MNFHPLILQDYFISHHFPNFQRDIQVLPNPSQKQTWPQTHKFHHVSLNGNHANAWATVVFLQLTTWQGQFFSHKMARMIAMSKWQQKLQTFKGFSVQDLFGLHNFGYPKSKFRGVNPGALMLGASQGDFFFRIWLESVIHWNMIVTRGYLWISFMYPTLEQVFWLQNRCFCVTFIWLDVTLYIFCCFAVLILKHVGMYKNCRCQFAIPTCWRREEI